MNNKCLLVFFLFSFVSLSSWAQFAPEKMKGGLFVENKGQWDDNILYRSEIPSGQLYIEKNRFLFNFYDQDAMAGHHAHGRKQHGPSSSQERAVVDDRGDTANFIQAHAYEVEFVGCSPISSTSGEGATGYNYNYFKGNDQSKWGSNAHAYSKTILNDIYPNTSLVCFGQETGFKYEFHLQAGANADVIQLKYNGVDTVYLKNGELFIETSITDFYEEKPFAYQEINGKNVQVPCSFKLLNNVLSFDFPKGYNKKFPLVIDPQLIFSTYSGSTADNWGNSATYDDDGNTYMVGIAFNFGYHATPGAYQAFYSGYAGLDTDVAIMKFNPTGKILYATYLGGGNTEIPSSCIVNSKKELVLFGFTGSDGIKYIGPAFPTTQGAYDRTFNGGYVTYPMTRSDVILFNPGSDLFISTINSDGSKLIASTLVGGSSNDGITNATNTFSKNYGDQFRGEIYCDDFDDIYIVTKTFSADIINKSVPGFDKTLNGLMDGYLFKMSPDLKKMYWDTYIGGDNEDVAYSIRVAADKSVYITGGTNSSNFPGTSGGLQSTYGGDIDAYVAHVSADGSTLIQSTYLGTSSYDQGFFIQLDNDENIFILGQSLGDYPMSPNVYGQALSGQFIQKINPTLTTSLLSTTFGSYSDSINIVPTAFLVNNCGNVLISGWGGNTNHYIDSYLKGNTSGLEVTPNAFMTETDGSDFYLLVLKKEFSELLYASFFGAKNEDDHVDGGTSRFDKNGIVYQSVCASCGAASGFPVSDGSKNKSINCNNACFKFDLSDFRADFTADPSTSCVGRSVDSIAFTNTSIGGVTFEWNFGDGTKRLGKGPFKHFYQKPGVYKVSLIVTDLTTCIAKDTAEKTITILPLPSIGVDLSDTTICLGDTLKLLITCNPTYSYSWSPNISISNTEICDAKIFPKETGNYYLRAIDENGCVYLDTITFKVATLAKGIGWENRTTCNGKPTARLSNPSTGPLNYLWTFGDGSSSTSPSPIHEYSKGGTYPIVLDLYNDYCSATEVGVVKIDDILIPNLFTPNNDGKNDCFEIKGLYPGWKVDVYNPWSSLIFKSDSYQNQFCGDGISTSVYYYLICAPYGECCKSWVHVISDK